MKKFIWSYLIATSLLLTACSNDADQNVITADRVFTGGTIYTVNDHQPIVEALAIKDGIIVYSGDLDGVQDYIGDSTINKNLAGRMLLPGFIDSHVHPIMGGAYVRSLSLETFATPAHWFEQITEYANVNSDKELLFGYGFLASAFGSEGPTKQMLDNIVADKPLFIMDEGFHGGWGNSKAMALLGITKDTKDPVPGFSYYKRDENGEPTGYFLENTATDAVVKLGVITIESVAAGTADIFEIMNSYGITSVFDAGAGDESKLQVSVLKDLVAKNKLTVRYEGSHMVSSAEQMDTAVSQSVFNKKLTADQPFKISMLKIMNDGTIEGKTAAMHEDYQGEPGNRGETVFTPEEMESLLEQATAADLDIHIHALGERTITEALDAIEIVRVKHPNKQNRITICHIQVMSDTDIPRFAKLNVIAQSTPLWTSFDKYGKPFVSADQFNRYFRFNSLKKAGVKMSFGSDFPASGAGTLGMSPLFNMEIGHTRQSPGKPNAEVQNNINERLDIASLIRGYTLDAAYQIRLENSIGSLEVGKAADLVILDKNLFEVEPYSIHKVNVVETILAGKTVYQAEK
ncbi:amidohydrolase [Colwelliaceae bacterium BS250]